MNLILNCTSRDKIFNVVWYVLDVESSLDTNELDIRLSFFNLTRDSVQVASPFSMVLGSVKFLKETVLNSRSCSPSYLSTALKLKTVTYAIYMSSIVFFLLLPSLLEPLKHSLSNQTSTFIESQDFLFKKLVTFSDKG